MLDRVLNEVSELSKQVNTQRLKDLIFTLLKDRHQVLFLILSKFEPIN